MFVRAHIQRHVLVLITFIQSVSLGAVIHVPSDQPDIQSAVNVAMDGDEIIVAPGVYNGSTNFLGKTIRLASSGPDDPSIVESTILDGIGSQQLIICTSGEGPETSIEGLTLRRGRRGTGGALQVRNSSVQVRNCVFEDNSANSTGGACFFRVSDSSFSNCRFVANSAAEGGAIYLELATVLIEDCHFELNTAGRGGAIYNEGGGSVDIIRCEFIRNIALESPGAVRSVNLIEDSVFIENESSGTGAVSGVNTIRRSDFLRNTRGAVSARDAELTDCLFEDHQDSAFSGSGHLTRCRFIRNVSAESGGGVAFTGVGSKIVSITDCHFLENEADQRHGGGVSCTGVGRILITGTVFKGNKAGQRGGGAYILSNGEIRDCIFQSNTAVINGGGLHSDDNPILISDTLFEENTSFGSGGGASTFSELFVERSTLRKNSAPTGGGVASISHAQDCTFEDNRAAFFGGAIFGVVPNGTIVNCLFDSNSAGELGGAVRQSNVDAQYVNCTFVGNHAPLGGGAFYTFSTGSNSRETFISNCIFSSNLPEQIADNFESTVNVTYSLVENGYPGDGNIDLLPDFTDPLNNDFSLRSDSPAIDAGNSAALPIGVFFDLAGNDRILDDPDTPDSGTGGTVIIDMGAFEYGNPKVDGKCFGDCDGSGIIDFQDLVSMLFRFGPAPEGDLCDLDRSGLVDFNDLVGALFVFGPCPE